MLALLNAELIQPGRSLFHRGATKERDETQSLFAPWSQVPIDIRISAISLQVDNVLHYMDYKFNDIDQILGIHPVMAGWCAEKGKKLIENDEGSWDILEKRS